MSFNTVSGKRQRGMTLIELLVVMVLLAVVSTLLVQGLGTGLATYERVQRRQFEGQPAMLASAWFSASLKGMEAALDSPRQFSGTANQVSGFSHQPLLGQGGEVQPLQWQLVNEDDGRLALRYHQQQWHWTLQRWPAGSEGRFVYYPVRGEAQSQWPVPQNPAPTRPEGDIPAAVMLEVTPPGQPPERWFVQLPGRTYPRGDYRDL